MPTEQENAEAVAAMQADFDEEQRLLDWFHAAVHRLGGDRTWAVEQIQRAIDKLGREAAQQKVAA